MRLIDVLASLLGVSAFLLAAYAAHQAMRRRWHESKVVDRSGGRLPTGSDAETVR